MVVVGGYAIHGGNYSPLPRLRGRGVRGVGAHSLASLLACSAGAPQDQYYRYSYVPLTPHDHPSAIAEWTVVGGYASFSLALCPEGYTNP